MRLNVSAKCLARCSRYSGRTRPRRLPARHRAVNTSSRTVCSLRRSTIISPRFDSALADFCLALLNRNAFVHVD